MMKKFLLLFVTIVTFLTMPTIHFGQVNSNTVDDFVFFTSDGAVHDNDSLNSFLTGDLENYTNYDFLGFGNINGVIRADLDPQVINNNAVTSGANYSGYKLTSTGLASADSFGILAGISISSTGLSEINGLDVGLSPGVRTSITGFPPATVTNGAIYAYDDIAPPGVAAMLDQAKQDLANAYLSAEGATAPAPITVAGDQGGKTLAPGIYKSTSTLSIQAGDLTLDAKGDVNATWIFQIGSALTTIGGAGGNVILTGGAQADNVIWQIGSSATIGDNTSFAGNILALTSITMNAGSSIEGRLLARDGSVVLSGANIINSPSDSVVTLSIELISFEIEREDNGIYLRWATAAEINNDYFTIERAAENGNFEAIGTVEGAGNSNQIKHYFFIDTDILNADYLYYRIKQTDYDGTSTYSWIEFFINEKNMGMSVFPNPVDHGQNLMIQSSWEYTILSLYNTLGVMVQSQETKQKRTSFVINHLESGLYVIHIMNPANQTSILKKVVIR